MPVQGYVRVMGEDQGIRTAELTRQADAGGFSGRR